MTHFLYLIGFALFVSVAFGALGDGSTRERIVYGIKTFFQFLVISLILAWVFYFIP
jgi:hypothetical protein